MRITMIIQPHTHTLCMVYVQPCPSPSISGRCVCSPSYLLSLTPSLPLSLHQQEEDEEEEEEEEQAKKTSVQRRPGDRWMLRGPIEYVPPVTVEVMLRRQAIPLDENEGIYVRDIKTGKVRQSGYIYLFYLFIYFSLKSYGQEVHGDSLRAHSESACEIPLVKSHL